MTKPLAQQLDDALRQHQAGDLAGAQSGYQAILEVEPSYSQAWHLLGLLQFQKGDNKQSLDCLSRAISLDPNQAVYCNNYGAVLLSAGLADEALRFLERAVSLQKGYIDAWLNLGRAQQSLKQSEAALKAFRMAAQVAPQHAEAQRLLASHSIGCGRWSEAIAAYQTLLGLTPKDATVWNELGGAYLADDQTEKASECCQRASELSPATPEIWFNLGVALAQAENTDSAGSALQRAVSLQPQRVEWQLRASLVCPPVFSSGNAIEEYCDTLERELQRFSAKEKSVDGQRLFAAGICPPLALSFQGRNNRALKETLAKAVRPAIRPRTKIESTAKPRVGFVVTRGHESLFLRCCGGLLERIESNDFDLFVFGSSAGLQPLRAGIKRADLNFIGFPDDYNAAVEVIGAARYDVLYHWEVGTDSLNYLLPFARLAPVQCTSWGTQVTSGLHEVDYYFSSELIESRQADQYCTEQLIRAPSLPTYQRRVPRPRPASRGEFGLADNAHLYLCPQNLLKLHPDQDDLFRAILELDPAGVIVLKERRSPVPGRELRKRLRASLGANAERVHFVPWQSQGDYYRLLSVADVILDPIHYSAGSSAYDLFSLDLPVITLPGEQNVSRYTQACYRQMEFMELVAVDADAYVRLAVHVATDGGYREHIRWEIRRRSDCLFEDTAAAVSLGDFLRMAIQQAHS